MSMKKTIYTIILLIFIINVLAQNWTEPINVSNMTGFNQVPDFCIDNNNIIHCVWTHVFEPNFSKIFYSKSYDDGLTWTTAEDISLNIEKRLSQPNIVCDSENDLHLTYDYDIYNYLATHVHYKKFDGTNWSDPVVVTEGMPESHDNKLVIDNNGRIYCFWYHSIDDGTTFYKYLENNTWSEIFCPYPGNFYLAVTDITVDELNKLHCIGSFHHEGQNHYQDVIAYFKCENNYWNPIEEISNYTVGPGSGIDVDSGNLPHITWRQKTPATGSDNDSTIYISFNGVQWNSPELIVEDPLYQKIIIDVFNKPNIFDSEKLDSGRMIVHHYKYGDEWLGYIIDDKDYNGFFNIKKHMGKLYIIYEHGIYDKDNTISIYFSKTDMITNYNMQDKLLLNLIVYPNPFYYGATIEFEINTKNKTQIIIYTLDGKEVIKLIDEQKKPGNYKIKWNGQDNSDMQCKQGIYLVRLSSGNNILTKSINLIK
jgi:hypothetical protein